MNEINQTIATFLQSVIPSSKLDEELLINLNQIVLLKEHSKGSTLLKEGEYCKYLFIVKKGFVRRYTLKNGKDITLEFARENEMITSLYSITTGQPTLDYLETLEDCIILKLKYEDLKKLYNSSKESLIIGKLLRDKYFLSLEKRILSFQNSSAKERYNNLIKKQPHILQRASLGQIASYLGIKQETLSRIRR